MKINKKIFCYRSLSLGVVLCFLLLVLLGSGLLFSFQKVRVSENASDNVLLIYPDTSFDEFCDTLSARRIVKSPRAFRVFASLLRYPERMQEGRFCIDASMNVIDLILKLNKGHQDPLRLQIRPARLKQDFVNKISSSLCFSSDSLLALLEDSSYLSTFGVTVENALTLFTPNTYEVWWTVAPKDFVRRMAKETEIFWKKREPLLQESGFSKQEVLILASIVEEETYQNSEKPRIAGVYINRLRKNMCLQADPTVKYALQDFTIKRVTNKHSSYDSPYNTYRNQGLPPTPINIPSIASIDAVLNYEKHNYLYFCAKDDFSGYHAFSSDFNQHLVYARAYHKALNKRKIY